MREPIDHSFACEANMVTHRCISSCVLRSDYGGSDAMVGWTRWHRDTDAEDLAAGAENRSVTMATRHESLPWSYFYLTSTEH